MEFTKEQTRYLMRCFWRSDKDLAKTIEKFEAHYGPGLSKKDAINILDMGQVIKNSANQRNTYGNVRLETIAIFVETGGNFRIMANELKLKDSILVQRCIEYGLETTKGPDYSLKRMFKRAKTVRRRVGSRLYNKGSSFRKDGHR